MVLYKVKEKANLFIHWSTCSNIYNVKFVLLSKSLLNHSERVNFNQLRYYSIQSNRMKIVAFTFNFRQNWNLANLFSKTPYGGSMEG